MKPPNQPSCTSLLVKAFVAADDVEGRARPAKELFEVCVDLGVEPPS
jgi:hypothetical protein